MPGRERRRLGAVTKPQLLEHMPDMRLHGGLADHKPFGDLAVAEPLREQREHLALALAQGAERIGSGSRAPREVAAAAGRPSTAAILGSPRPAPSTASISSSGAMSLSRYPAAPTRSEA